MRPVNKNFRNSSESTKAEGLDSRRQELRWIMLAHNLRGLAHKRLREQAAREASQKQNRRVRKAPPKKAA